MIMVALGSTGVLWQNVTRRTKEIEVRRAEGPPTAWNIHQQNPRRDVNHHLVQLNRWRALIVHFPLFDVIDWISGQVYALSFVISLAVIVH